MDPKYKACPICHGLGYTRPGPGYTTLNCKSCGASGKVRDDGDHQPAPDSVWATVIRDMAGRDAVGLRKYGRPLQAGDGRDTLWDAYEEALDLAVYLRKAIIERDSQEITAPISVPDPTALPEGWEWRVDPCSAPYPHWAVRDSDAGVLSVWLEADGAVRGRCSGVFPDVVAAVKAKNGVQ